MNKKNLKGMTLVEIIVAMAIFAMLGVILVTLGSNVDISTRSANRLNKRVAIQAPYAASQDTEYSYETKDGDGNIIVTNAKLDPNLTNIEVFLDSDNDNTPDVVSVKSGGSTSDVNSDTKIYGSRFSTKDIVDNAAGKEVYDPNEVSNSEHHLQFINIIDRIEIEKSMAVGETFQITFDGPDDDGDGDPDQITPQNTVWNSTADAADIATIDASGKITAIGAGDCVYVGEADGGVKMTVILSVA